ncbi:hypothetical protein KY308_03525 [Candidatus Woesearchaeota archaeon]|nr:hypothetical protein [Candidatus Woesearchaeota archaeon]
MLADIIIAAVLSIAYFFSESFFERLKKVEAKLASFSAGLFITSIFLLMMPVLTQDFEFTGFNTFLIALWGFVILHIFEKYVLQHSQKSSHSRNLLKLRMFTQVLNHIMLGFTIAFFFIVKAPIIGYVITFPVAVYLFSSAVVSEESHKKFHSTLTGKLIASVSIFIGALVAIIIGKGIIMEYVFSFAIGLFIYTIVRDVMPAERKGNVFYFLYGIITYFLVFGFVVLYLALTS